MNEKQIKPRCYNCKFFLKEDTGYSNYTVLGTDITCLKDMFETVEESYSWEMGEENPENDSDFFKQAENCPHFKEGLQMYFDCDRETTIDEVKDDNELYDILKEKRY